jgi:siroheme synthase-like protein
MMVKLRLQNRMVVVIGATDEAVQRANSFVSQGARVLLVGTPARGWTSLISVRDDSSLSYRYAKRPRRKDLKRAALVVATDRDAAINAWLSAKALRYRFLLNTLDVPEYCDYYHVAIRRPHPDIELGVSTNGHSPAFASSLATRLAKAVTDDDCHTYEVLKQIRQQLRQQGQSPSSLNWVQLELETRQSRLQEARRAQL